MQTKTLFLLLTVFEKMRYFITFKINSKDIGNVKSCMFESNIASNASLDKEKKVALERCQARLLV